MNPVPPNKNPILTAAGAIAGAEGQATKMGGAAVEAPAPERARGTDRTIADKPAEDSGERVLVTSSEHAAVIEKQERLEGAQGRVPSTSDARVVNNVMRHEYRVLSDKEKLDMQLLKDKGLEFYNLLHAIGGTDRGGDRLGSRELALAATKIEEAVMWAVKHITR